MVNMKAHVDVKSSTYVRGGTSIVYRKPEFSHDSKLLMCCSGPSIRVLSVTSGECIHKLHGHTANVTGIKLNPQNPYQVLSCSLDRTIIKWDYKDGLLVRKYTLNGALHSLYTTANTEQHSIYAVCKTAVSYHNCNLVSFTLPPSGQDHIETVTILRHVSSDQHCVDVSTGGEFAACVRDNKLQVCDISTLTTKSHKLDSPAITLAVPVTLSCVACHPSQHCVATGSSDGKIIMWYNILNKKKVTKSVNHWHSVTVRHLAFTLEGSYLLSGGHECVLVKWQWNSSHRDFLPRLNSPIISITCSRDNTHYALCHADNGIQVVLSSFQLMQTYQGLTQAHLDYSNTAGIIAGLSLDPKTGAIVTNGKPGHLQFYDVTDDKQLFNLDIISQNFTSPEDLRHPHTTTRIECVAFSSTGDWFATIERWDDGQMTPEIRLKFWIYIVETQGYKLNTLVEQPHKQKVHALMFRPSRENRSPMAVTASSDGTFKIWALTDDTDIYRANQCWVCESVGFYRSETPGCLDMSEDGTLLSVAFNDSLTLWNPDTNGLLKTLTVHRNTSNIRHVLFGAESCSHYLMSVTAERLYAWNLLTCTVTWSVSLQASILISCPQSDMFAVFTKQNQVSIYTPKSDKLIWTKTLPQQGTPKVAIFLPNRRDKGNEHDSVEHLPWQPANQLYYMNENQELVTLDVLKDEEVTPSTTVLVQNLPQTPINILLSNKRKVSHVRKQSQTVGLETNQSGDLFLKEILSTPAHVLPPVATLSMNFLDTLLRPSTSSPAEPSDSDSDDDVPIDDTDDSDSDEPSSSRAPGGATDAVANHDYSREFAEERHAEYKKYTGNALVNEMFNWLS